MICLQHVLIHDVGRLFQTLLDSRCATLGNRPRKAILTSSIQDNIFVAEESDHANETV